MALEAELFHFKRSHIHYIRIQSLTLNSPSASSPSLLWETSKAYAWGLIISYTASKGRKTAKQQKVLEARLTKAMKDYIRKPIWSKLKEIIVICCALNSLLTQIATDMETNQANI